MGLLLSILVGCVGVLELLSCLKKVTNEVTAASTGPITPCLSYHETTDDIPSFHDSLCSISHSGDIPFNRSAKRKLENLHEYSLRVRSELKSAGSERGTLSECSTRDILSPSRTDSRHSLANFDGTVIDDLEADEKDVEAWKSLRTVLPTGRTFGIVVEDRSATDRCDIENIEDDGAAAGLLLGATVLEYVRVPTPIPIGISEELSQTDSSLSSSAESGNEAPTKLTLDHVSARLRLVGNEKTFSRDSIAENEPTHQSRKKTMRMSRSPETKKKGRQPIVIEKSVSPVPIEDEPTSSDIKRTETSLVVDEEPKMADGTQRRVRSDRAKTPSAILRKPTRLKSRNAETSKSAESLVGAKRTKRQREPERRKSDISVQTIMRADSLRDEWTNTSPTNSEVSLADSRASVSVQVQTSFDEGNDFAHLENPPLGLSESPRDVGFKDSDGRRAFRSRRFAGSNGPKSRSLDDYSNSRWIVGDLETFGFSRNDGARSDLKRFEVNDLRPADYDSRTRKEEKTDQEESSMDEEFVDAEEASTSLSGDGPIEYRIPSFDASNDKPFWLIFSGEYTKAMNKDWHSGHFCCWQCDESLTGQRYVLRDEHPYCIKCYESVFANGCEECSKIIGIDSKDLSYKDKHWHEACFLCNKCRVSLVDKQFGSKVDKIYCGNCYDAQFASRCDGCGEIFRAGTKKMEYKTRQWHEKCFCCVVCRNPIGTKSFIPREQEIYCAGCYEDKFATRCVKCNKIITSSGVTYKNEPWHRDCFTCSNCNNSLAGQRFTSRDDKPYCAECFGELFAKRCTACTKPITGIGGTRFISFEDRHWHNNCFICAGCNTSLVGRGFITDGDDIICPECAKQKLSE